MIRGFCGWFIEVNVLNERGYLYSELTGAVIGSALEVHSISGTGFQEVVYQRALGYEMERRGLSFAREWEVPIFYKERQVGTGRSWWGRGLLLGRCAEGGVKGRWNVVVWCWRERGDGDIA